MVTISFVFNRAISLHLNGSSTLMSIISGGIIVVRLSPIMCGVSLNKLIPRLGIANIFLGH